VAFKKSKTPRFVHCQKNARKSPCSATCDSDAKANDTDFSVVIYSFDETDFSIGSRKILCENAKFPRQLWIAPFSYFSVVKRIFPFEAGKIYKCKKEVYTVETQLKHY
jgi:hypothetical protein